MLANRMTAASFTKVYAGGVQEPEYVYNDDSYTALGAAGVDWRDSIALTRHIRPVIFRYIGAVLSIAGRLPDGRWLVVNCIEESDESYLVVSARYPDAAESAVLATIMDGGHT